MRASVEIEWQLEGASLRTVRQWLSNDVPAPFSVEPRARVTQRDTYWDTPAWHLYRSSVALRTRRTPGGLVATLKEIVAARGDVSRRREATIVLDPTARPSAATLLATRGPFGARLRRLVDSTDGLARLFDVVTQRARFLVRTDDTSFAELVLDRTAIVRSGRTRKTLERVEVELIGRSRPRTEKVAERFVAALRRGTNLRPAARTKFESGLAACRLDPPG